MADRAAWLRLGALLSAGAFGVHQLPYLIAYGGDASQELHVSGHGYLTAIESLIGLALAFAVAGLLQRWLVGGRVTRLPSRWTLMVTIAGALLLLFTGQELLEGELSSGHAQRLAGVFGAGGWISVPLAFACAALLSLLVRLAERAAGRPAPCGSSPRPRVYADARLVLPAPYRSLSGSLLARHLASRGPPVLLR